MPAWVPVLFELDGWLFDRSIKLDMNSSTPMTVTPGSNAVIGVCCVWGSVPGRQWDQLGPITRYLTVPEGSQWDQLGPITRYLTVPEGIWRTLEHR